MNFLEVVTISFLFVSYIGLYEVLALQCYSCSAEDTNENCVGSNHVQTCSFTQDRCLTQVTYSRERGKLGIDKSCASQQSCMAATDQLAKYYFCDKSRDGWGCVECCAEDRCNESRGVNPHRTAPLLTVMASFTVLLCIYVM